MKVEGKTTEEDFRPGVRGKALDLTRAATNGIAFDGYAVLPLKQGTIEFWFRPLDWNNFFHGDYLGMDLPWLTLLRFAPKGCEPWRGPSRALRIAQGRNHRDFSSGTPWVQFQPGRWTHVVCAWMRAARASTWMASPSRRCRSRGAGRSTCSTPATMSGG